METIYIELGKIDKIENLSVCLGYFDAIHLGHMELINRAKETGNKVAVMTLEPNPKAIFGGSNKVINSFSDREEILSQIGVDYFIVLKANLNLLSLSPEEFINEVIIKLGAKVLVCGFDYTFGKERKGNAKTLRELSINRYKVEVINEIKNEKNQKISSTLIQNLIEDGKVELANKYLFRPYQIKGIVNKGNRIGNTIGFPTANISLNKSFIIPKKGVYKGKCIIDGKTYLSMINIGTHPTIKENEEEILEAHVIDFDEEIYNEEIVVIFEEFLRPETRFNSLEELVNQLNKDKQYIINKK